LFQYNNMVHAVERKKYLMHMIHIENILLFEKAFECNKRLRVEYKDI